MTGLQTVPQPDDSGSDAFTRFRYQAHVAFPFCLECWSEGTLTAIYCEHFEDLLIESVNELRFIAIKTRNPEYGAWRLADLCGSNGAFRSLLRTYRALQQLEDPRPIVLEARLEGALKRDDLIRELLTPREGNATPQLISSCSELLSCEEGEAEDFIRHVHVVDREPPREFIQDRNMKFLGTVAGGMTTDALRAIYEDAIGLIEQAMTAALLDDLWPQAILLPDSVEEAAATTAKAKRLDESILGRVFAPLAQEGKPLLIGEIDPSLLRATALERKLVASGADADVVSKAKELRARAGRHLEEVRAARRGQIEEQLEDLNSRLLAMAEAVAASIGHDRPANRIWLGLLDRLLATPAAFDTGHILRQDSFLLAGQVCQLSDECQFRWGGLST